MQKVRERLTANDFIGKVTHEMQYLTNILFVYSVHLLNKIKALTKCKCEGKVMLTGRSTLKNNEWMAWSGSGMGISRNLPADEVTPCVFETIFPPEVFLWIAQLFLA